MKRLWAIVMAVGLMAVGLMAVTQPPAHADTTSAVTLEVTPEVGRSMARQALQTGDPDLTVRIAAQLLAANPDDVGAQLLLTAGLTRSGHAAEAVPEGRKGFHLAKTAAQRFEAAYLTAEALSAQDRPYAAKFWLRQADTYRADPPQRDILQDAFRKLDARTPFKISVSFGGGPANNVNGGSLHDTFYFWGIPIPIAQALPGTTFSSAVKLSYRLISRPKFEAVLYATGGKRNVWLDARARGLQPGARDADFRYDSLDVGGSLDWMGSDSLAYKLDARVGRQWQAGFTQSNQQRLVFGVTKALKRGRAINLDLTAETSQIPNLPRANALQLAADASLAQALPGGNLRYDLGLTQVDSKAAGIAYRAVSAAVDWQGNRAILGVIPELFAQGEVRQYWKTSGFRPDIRAEAGIVAQFSNLSAYGFSPSVTLSFARSVSQIVVRDTSNVSVSFAVVSSF